MDSAPIPNDYRIVNRDAVVRMFVDYEMHNPAEVARSLAESSWDDDPDEYYDDPEYLRSELQNTYRQVITDSDLIRRAFDWGLGDEMLEKGYLVKVQ